METPQRQPGISIQVVTSLPGNGLRQRPNLANSELKHYQKITITLVETDKIMSGIDNV